MRLGVWLGMAGVARNENPVAQVMERMLEPALMIAALWVPLEYYLSQTSVASAEAEILAWSHWGIWTLFAVETALMLLLVRERGRYLRGNWMNLVIITAGFPPFWSLLPGIAAIRLLRTVLLVSLLARAFRHIGLLLGQHALGAALLAAVVMVFFFGVLAAAVEPGIERPMDGFWWALVTITTVGYGDIVPETDSGRILGVVLIIFGVVIVSLLTAGLASLFLSGGIHKVEREESHLGNTLARLDARLDRIEQRLEERERAFEAGSATRGEAGVGRDPGRSRR